MIDLYTRPDADGQKVQIMLEECGLGHALHVLDPQRPDDELPSRYTAICADRQAPAIVDHDSADGRAMPVSQAGAILIYLAGKTGRFLPKADRDRFKMLEWLLWSPRLTTSAAGEPLDGAPPLPAGDPSLGILEAQLARTRAFVAGRQYTIADIAIVSDCLALAAEPAGFDAYPAVRRWLDTILARAPVKRALATMHDSERRARATDSLEMRMRGTSLEAR